MLIAPLARYWAENVFCGYVYEERKSILSQIAKSSFLRQYHLFLEMDGMIIVCFNKRISLLNILYQTNALSLILVEI